MRAERYFAEPTREPLLLVSESLWASLPVLSLSLRMSFNLYLALARGHAHPLPLLLHHGHHNNHHRPHHPLVTQTCLIPCHPSVTMSGIHASTANPCNHHDGCSHSQLDLPRFLSTLERVGNGEKGAAASSHRKDAKTPKGIRYRHSDLPRHTCSRLASTNLLGRNHIPLSNFPPSRNPDSIPSPLTHIAMHTCSHNPSQAYAPHKLPRFPCRMGMLVNMIAPPRAHLPLYCSAKAQPACRRREIYKSESHARGESWDSPFIACRRTHGLR